MFRARLAAASFATFALVTLAPAAPAAAQPAQTVRVAGSTTLAPVLARWSQVLEGRPQPYRLQVDAQGSSHANTALLAGAAEVGASSRLMKPEELAAWRSRGRPEPLGVRVGLDALVVFVHPTNPASGRAQTRSGETSA
jgi:phosphate transport system substrate-binding protein